MPLRAMGGDRGKGQDCVGVECQRRGGGEEPSVGGQQTCVGAGVPLEFVTPREPLSTEEPVADKRPLASVQAHVGPQQGRLPESLAAVGDMAHVLLLALLSGPKNGRWGRGKRKRREGEDRI